MRKSLVLKSVLLSVLLNGAVIATAHAGNLAYEISRIGNSCEESGPQLGLAVEEQGGAPFTVASGLGVPTSVSDMFFADNTKEQFNNLIASATKVGASVNSSACDGLMAELASSKVSENLEASGKILGGVSEAFASQPNAVSLPAAAWLFSSALFGFVVVANRRKV